MKNSRDKNNKRTNWTVAPDITETRKHHIVRYWRNERHISSNHFLTSTTKISRK